MKSEKQIIIQDIAQARAIARQYNNVELLDPSCDAEEWTLCEQLLKVFQYSLKPASRGQWQAELASMDLGVVGRDPREAVLRCFFAHMKLQSEIF